jgi:hypothetical protein
MTDSPVEFDLDVAFSFLSEDEATATALDERLRDRLRTFIYPENQREIAGTDGEETFGRVFGVRARTVVVLYRDGWGKSHWTRIEETAIRNRGYEEGYDFATFVVLDPKAQLPRWLPKARLWVNFDRFGLDGAAAVIEQRVKDAGGEAREETATELAARLQREAVAREENENFLFSDAGVFAARAEVRRLVEEVRRRAEAISTPKTTYRFKADADSFTVDAPEHSLSAGHKLEAGNSLRGAKLQVGAWRGHFGPEWLEGAPKRVAALAYHFDRDLVGEHGWRESFGDRRFLTSSQVGDHLLKVLLQAIEKDSSDREGR